MRRYRCTLCNHVYDPAEGDPDSGIPPGTPFERLPNSWFCPECHTTTNDDEPIDD